VELLKRHIDVDVFGSCGTKQCGRNNEHHSDQCKEMLERDYRYYLSFENSFCNGYVTEKFYKGLDLDLIPIVMGGSDYTNRAPPNSYINVLDFETPKDLADYLIRLANNETEYQQYFWWKDHYVVHNDQRLRSAQAICNLCEKLNRDDIETKFYDTMGPWWWGLGHCARKGQVPWNIPKSKWSERILKHFPLG